MPKGYNPSDVASMNGRECKGVPRPNAKGQVRGQQDNRGNYSVAPEPVSDLSFCWDRVNACQNIAWEKYTCPEVCSERKYFTKVASDVLLEIQSSAAQLPPFPEMLQILISAISLHSFGTTVTEDELHSVLNLKHIRYSQLEPRQNPPISSREPPRDSIDYVPDSVFESYEVKEEKQIKDKKTGGYKTVTEIKTFVQAPRTEGGMHYELTNVRKWPWTLRFLFALKLDFDKDMCGDPGEGMIDYALELQLAYRGKEHVYEDGQGFREQCVKVSLGEINIGTGDFVAWSFMYGIKQIDCIMLGGKELVDRLFYQHNWPLAEGQVDPASDHFDAPRTLKWRYSFEIVDDCASVWQPGKHSREDGEWCAIANFYIVQNLNVYQFIDGSHRPYHKILCRHLLDSSASGTYYLSTDDSNRSPTTTGFKYLDVEVLIECSEIRSQSDVRALFKDYHPLLDSSQMTPDMLACYMVTLGYPHCDAVITKFGRQINGYFVAGNCVYGDGQIRTLADMNVAIIPKYFENSLMPLPRSDYPKHIIIPFPHVRYAIGVNVWQYLMPRVFLNNEIQAKAVLAMSVIGMHASKIWAGQTGFGHGAPVTWVWSHEPNTGKTEASLLAHSLLGFYNRSLWAGV